MNEEQINTLNPYPVSISGQWPTIERAHDTSFKCAHLQTQIHTGLFQFHIHTHSASFVSFGFSFREMCAHKKNIRSRTVCVSFSVDFVFNLNFQFVRFFLFNVFNLDISISRFDSRLPYVTHACIFMLGKRVDLKPISSNRVSLRSSLFFSFLITFFPFCIEFLSLWLHWDAIFFLHWDAFGQFQFCDHDAWWRIFFLSLLFFCFCITVFCHFDKIRS